MTSVRAVPCTEGVPALLLSPSTPTLMEPTWAGGLHHSGNEPGLLELVKIGSTEGLGEVEFVHFFNIYYYYYVFKRP